MTSFSLRDKVGLVTGAGRGIGAAIARELAARGAWVCVNDRDEETARATAGAIRDAGGAAEPFRADVSTAAEVQSLVEFVSAQRGQIDLLVNNAGIGGTGKSLVELSETDWTEMIRVNLQSVFLLCRAVVPLMLHRKRGRIVNLSSIFALSGAAGSCPYAAAKAGIIGLSKSLARELAPHSITVNVIAPGLIDTPMFRARGVEAKPPWLLWPRLGQPEDVAHTVAFLCSDEAEFITGQVISPNGGGWM